MNKLFGLYYWVRIFLSPFAISLIIAGVVVVSTSTIWGQLIASAVVLAGTITGTIFAERMRMKHGTTAFMGKLYSTDDFNRRTH